MLAVLHDPVYRQANAGALRMEWPRIPLPHWPTLAVGTVTGDGGAVAKAEEAADTLAASATRGRELAALLDPETPVPSVTTGQLRREVAAIAVPATTHGRNMFGDDFGLTAGWGHFGSGQAVMPGQGRAVERAYTGSERAALAATLDNLGETTYDIHLNDNAYWRECPGRRMELPAGRVPGAEEVVVVSGAEGVGGGRCRWTRCGISVRWQGRIGAISLTTKQ